VDALARAFGLADLVDGSLVGEASLLQSLGVFGCLTRHALRFVAPVDLRLLGTVIGLFGFAHRLSEARRVRERW
jgi:hypothetical protein